MVMVGVARPAAGAIVVWAAETVMAAGLSTWLLSVAMVPSVVMGVASEALALCPPAPARLVDTVPVTVPSVVTPAGRVEGKRGGQLGLSALHHGINHWEGGAALHAGIRTTNSLCRVLE